MKNFFLFSILFASFSLAEISLSQTSCDRSPSRNQSRNNAVEHAKQVRSQSADLSQWVSPKVLGFQLGKSTVSDVKKKFGKPVWEGSNQEKVFTEDSEDEILVQYRDIAQIDLQLGKVDIDFVIGEQTKIVKAITIYPTARLTKDEIIAKYGSRYFENESWESFCIDKNRETGSTGRKRNYPVVLMYPNEGMYVIIHEDNYAIHIGYMEKCVAD